MGIGLFQLLGRGGLLLIVAVLLWLPSSVDALEASRPIILEYYQGPVVSSNRIIGMGGAFIGVAEGADAHLMNPAAYATRYRHTRGDWFDYDWALSWISQSGGADAALNVAPVAANVDKATFFELGLNLKFGSLGVGLHGAPHRFEYLLGWEDEDGNLNVEESAWVQNFAGLGMAYAFARGELVVGLGLQTTALRLESVARDGATIFEVNATQLMWGVLYAPHGQPWRLGARYRSGILGEPKIEGDIEPYGFTLVPEGVVSPVEIATGASWRFGERPYNPRYTYADDEPAAETSGDSRYVLVAGDVIWSGATADAVGFEAFMAQEYHRAGADATLGARVGVESEVLANWLRLRAGSYYEPSRYEGLSGRVHATGGADLRVPLGWDWRLNTAVDVARGYVNYGLGVGFWH